MTDLDRDAAQALTLLDDLVRRAMAGGATAADALYVGGSSVSATVRLGRQEKLERAEGGEIGLRVLIGHRQALVASADTSPATLATLVERALDMARVVPEDPHVGLADPADLALERPDIDGCDPGEVSVETLTRLVETLEGEALAVPGVTNSEGAEASWGRSTVALVGSNGFSHAYHSSHVGLGVAVVAGQGTEGMEIDHASASAVYLADLRDPAEVGREAGTRAVRRLGATRLPTKTRPVVFDPRVARGLVGHLLGAINGGSIARGTSFLKDSLGQRILPAGVSVIEDPHRPRGLRSRPVDAEGLPTRRRSLVDDGTLTTWLLDLRTARVLGLKSTGHASRGTGAPPSPGASNVWLTPGPLSPAELIAGIDDGLYVTDLFGQGVNGLTGDYSRGAAGLRIENGVLTTPVNEVTIAGTLQRMFAALTPASDLELRHGVDAPTVLVGEMMVAGA
ncbi:TldD/PmbA family protein [Pararhodospirillum oryzae]|uniref:Modulator protein n=1 Tax=Pararhodospirillum oryzae TaxID=478448 RepID=A0A512H3H3_9PROT|nr:TldD/PmbA family protein [Pararhodospirillum oryzae]GEO79950.1 modulator protein [Pararhodospirillum oryzae]